MRQRPMWVMLIIKVIVVNLYSNSLQCGSNDVFFFNKYIRL